jgi:hypothetical protein
MKEITPERLAELKRLADEATPGPWRASDRGTELCIHTPTDVVCNMVGISQADHDATFIAASRAAIPELLADIARLKTVVAEYEEDIANLKDEIASLEGWNDGDGDYDEPEDDRPTPDSNYDAGDEGTP